MEATLLFLFGKARALILEVLSNAVDEGVPLHLREIARRSRISPTAVQYELRLLRQLDLVKDIGTPARPLYVLNQQHYLVDDLRRLFSRSHDMVLADDAHFQHKRLRQAEDRKASSAENSTFLRERALQRSKPE